jgi:competence protein ComEA
MRKPASYGYLDFTSKERNGIIVLCGLILIVIFLPKFYGWVFPQKYMESPMMKAKLDSIDAIFEMAARDTAASVRSARRKDSLNAKRSETDVNLHSELFYFDPNKLSLSGWKKLGIKESTIKTIENYLSKGGKFYVADDIKKIWGLQRDLADRLIPYVRIEISETTDYVRNTERKNSPARSSKININTADSLEFLSLPGIGPKLSQRIIRFREKLGGFYKIEQVAETFGLPDSTFNKIKDKLTVNGQVRLLNINTASEELLNNHPYFQRSISNSIIQYRSQHGNFRQVRDIKNIMIITDEVYARVLPYITIE